MALSVHLGVSFDSNSNHDLYEIFGPNFIFEVSSNKTLSGTMIRTIERSRCTLQCQPREDSLICLMWDFSSRSILYLYEDSKSFKSFSREDIYQDSHMFKMVFDIHGVQTLMPKPSPYESMAYTISQITKMFNANVDLANKMYIKKRESPNDRYVNAYEFNDWEEDTVRGNCSVRYRLWHDENVENFSRNQFQFYFVMPPLYLDELKIKENLSIVKNVMHCHHPEGIVSNQKMVREHLFCS